MPEALTTLDTGAGEIGHVFPDILPGGNAVLFVAASAIDINRARIVGLSLETGAQRVLAERAVWPRYMTTGHLVYAQQGALMAVPFDIDRIEVTGPPVPVTESRMANPETVPAQLAVSTDDGTLVYVPVPLGPDRTLVWVDRQGKEEPLAAPARPYRVPRLSPDGARLALDLDDLSDVWIWDLPRETLTRLTFHPGLDYYPLWTPDGQRVVFTSSREGPFNLFWKAADGTGSAERLTASESIQWAGSWSPDGKVLVFDEKNPEAVYGIMVLSLEGKPATRPLVRTQFNEANPTISPDGRWIAYQWDESGRWEVLVRPFPDVDSGRWQISTNGGSKPVWAPNGKELFYRNGDKMMAVSVETESSFNHGNPKVLFERHYFMPRAGARHYDISPDGQRFLMIKESEKQAPLTELIVVENWFEELKRLAPVRKNR
jgi:serine/threonine-protein kinase